MELELICTEQPHPKRAFSIRVGTAPIMLNLFSYLSDMQNMLGAVDTGMPISGFPWKPNTYC